MTNAISLGESLLEYRKNKEDKRKVKSIFRNTKNFITYFKNCYMVVRCDKKCNITFT